MINKNGQEQGNIVLVTLFVFFIVCILVMMVLQLSSLEMHMSEYYYRSLQAQQLADGAMEQCCAEIAQSLRDDYTDTSYIPELPLGWREQCCENAVINGEAVYWIRFLEMTLGADYCCYRVLFEGCFANASKSVQAELTFYFTNVFDEEGATIRSFLDYGIITDYQIMFN